MKRPTGCIVLKQRITIRMIQNKLIYICTWTVLKQRQAFRIRVQESRQKLALADSLMTLVRSTSNLYILMGIQ